MVIIEIQGGLGNQMFEYACARSFTINSNEKLVIRIAGFAKDNLRNYSLKHLNILKNIQVIDENEKIFNNYILFLKLVTKLLNLDLNSERVYLNMCNWGYYYSNIQRYIKLPITKCPIKYFQNYYQSEKYFSEYKDIIKHELMVSSSPSSENKMWIDKISRDNNSVCLHIRRGDYVGNKVHQICSNEYYVKSINIMKAKLNNPTFYAFSEDISYVKSLNLDCNIIYIEQNNIDYEELRLMYNCKHFIMSNSSFSWWAQYLSNYQKKIVIAPNRWYADERFSNPDIYMDNWILVNPTT